MGPKDTHPEQRCRGSACDDLLRCATAGKCTYKSSADEAREIMKLLREPKPEGGFQERWVTDEQADGIGIEKIPAWANVEEKSKPQPIADFVGKVDGGGIKQVMFSPKSGVQMISPHFVEGIGNVLTYGAKKYAKNNWMRGMSQTEVFGGILRHLFAWFRGEDKDESGMPHLWHAACGLMFLVHFTSDEKYVQFDDRVFK